MVRSCGVENSPIKSPEIGGRCYIPSNPIIFEVFKSDNIFNWLIEIQLLTGT